MNGSRPLLQLAVPLLLVNALLTLVNPGPTPWPQPTARVAPELCAALLLAAAWAGWRGGVPQWLVRTLALACTVLAVVRLAEVSSAALYDRTLHIYWDGRHLGQALADQGVARWQVVLGAGALALAGWLLYRLLLANWRMLGSALTVRPLRHAALGASALLLAVFAAHGVHGLDRYRWFAGSITPVLARQLALTALLLPRDAAAQRLTPSPAFDSDLAGLQGADVLLLFSESYGVSTLDRPAQDAALAAPRAALAQAIAAGGRWAVSARVRSPTFAGGSWLAHGALLSGVDTRDPLDYELLLSSQRRTLVQHFGTHGWRTVGWMPGCSATGPKAASSASTASPTHAAWATPARCSAPHGCRTRPPWRCCTRRSWPGRSRARRASSSFPRWTAMRRSARSRPSWPTGRSSQARPPTPRSSTPWHWTSRSRCARPCRPTCSPSPAPGPGSATTCSGWRRRAW